ncbi:MAG TPA: hypothetical protein VHG29_01885 [Novosphingobium sp.]|nr:hypothetical protein [Novosphingobium sp.]
MTRPTVTAAGALILSWVAFATPASAACTVPNVITNGQVADATKVMEDFNAVAACTDEAVKPTGSPQTGAIAVISGPKTVTSGNLSGDVTTSGGTATALAATGVTPGTYVYPTFTVDAKGRITGATNGSSGTSQSVPYFNGLTLPVPITSNFTVTANSNFGSNYGLQTAAVGVSLYGGNTAFNFAWADQAVPSGGTTGDFAVTGLIKLAALNKGNHAIGITLGDGTRRLTWGFRNTQLWMSRTSRTGTSDGYWTYGGDIGAISSPTLFRIRKTGATIYFEIALDGKNFDVITSEAASAYLASNVTTFGIGILPNNAYQRIVCYGLLGG